MLHKSASASGLHRALNQIIYSKIILFLLSFYKLSLLVRRITLSAFILLSKTRKKLDHRLTTWLNCSLSPWLWFGLLHTAVCKAALICRGLLLRGTHINAALVAWTGSDSRSSSIQQLLKAVRGL